MSGGRCDNSRFASLCPVSKVLGPSDRPCLVARAVDDEVLVTALVADDEEVQVTAQVANDEVQVTALVAEEVQVTALVAEEVQVTALVADEEVLVTALVAARVARARFRVRAKLAARVARDKVRVTAQVASLMAQDKVRDTVQVAARADCPVACSARCCASCDMLRVDLESRVSLRIRLNNYKVRLVKYFEHLTALRLSRGGSRRMKHRLKVRSLAKTVVKDGAALFSIDSFGRLHPIESPLFIGTHPRSVRELSFLADILVREEAELDQLIRECPKKLPTYRPVYGGGGPPVTPRKQTKKRANLDTPEGDETPNTKGREPLPGSAAPPVRYAN